MPFLFGLAYMVFSFLKDAVEYSSRNPCRSSFDSLIGIFIFS